MTAPEGEEHNGAGYEYYEPEVQKEQPPLPPHPRDCGEMDVHADVKEEQTEAHEPREDICPHGKTGIFALIDIIPRFLGEDRLLALRALAAQNLVGGHTVQFGEGGQKEYIGQCRSPLPRREGAVGYSEFVRHLLLGVAVGAAQGRQKFAYGLFH